MPRVKKTIVVKGGKPWKYLSDISSFDIAAADNAKVRSRVVTGGDTFASIGNKLVDEARRKIVAADKVDTGLMWSSVRHKWKVKNFNEMEFTLMMGAQGGETAAIATAYGGTQFGTLGRKINYTDVSKRAEELPFYAALWENEYGFIKKTMREKKKFIESNYLDNYDYALEQKMKGEI